MSGSPSGFGGTSSDRPAAADVVVGGTDVVDVSCVVVDKALADASEIDVVEADPASPGFCAQAAAITATATTTIQLADDLTAIDLVFTAPTMNLRPPG